jgi:tetratricopeptide (TPR) repeat protein
MGLVLVLPGVARAAGPNGDAAEAQVLFEEGRRLMAAGDLASACPKFAASQEREPASGTALNLGVCYEKAGKLASAWAAFETAEALAASAGQKDRMSAAKKKAAQLASIVSRLTISVPAASAVAGLQVRRDGDLLEAAEWGVSTPRDGGGHDVEATAPGKKPWTRHVELQPRGQSLTVEIPVLEDAPVPAPAAVAAGPTAPGFPSSMTAEPPRPATPSASSRSRVLDWSLMGGGVAVGAAGTAIMLVEAGAAGKDSNRGDYNSAKTLWEVGLATTIVGAAALVAGGIVFFGVDAKVDARGSLPSLWVGTGLGDVRLGGSW